MDRKPFMMLHSTEPFVLSQDSFFHFMTRLAVPLHDCFLFAGLNFAPILTTRGFYAPYTPMPGGPHSINSINFLQGLFPFFRLYHHLPTQVCLLSLYDHPRLICSLTHCRLSYEPSLAHNCLPIQITHQFYQLYHNAFLPLFLYRYHTSLCHPPSLAEGRQLGFHFCLLVCPSI